jgi:hypothetical protein
LIGEMEICRVTSADMAVAVDGDEGAAGSATSTSAAAVGERMPIMASSRRFRFSSSVSANVAVRGDETFEGVDGAPTFERASASLYAPASTRLEPGGDAATMSTGDNGGLSPPRGLAAGEEDTSIRAAAIMQVWTVTAKMVGVMLADA